MLRDNPISENFQRGFNKLVAKKGLKTKKEIREYATTFYILCRRKFSNYDQCYFPCYLAEHYFQDLKNGKL